MGVLSYFINFFISSAYLIGWVLLAVGLGHNRWIYFSPDGKLDEANSRLGKNYPCHAGLWQTCCPSDYWSKDLPEDNDVFIIWEPFEDVTLSPTEDDTIECNANAFLWVNETKQVTLIGEGLPETTYLRLEIWMLRCVMLVAAGLPLLGFISTLCGNRFFGFVSICVAGMFGMTAVLLGLFFTMQYFGRDDQELPEADQFLINGEYGETTYCLMGGVACIWFFSLLDCIACSRYYRATKKTYNNDKDELSMENPYGDSDSEDGISTSSL